MEREILKLQKLHHAGVISEEEYEIRLSRYGKRAECGANYPYNFNGLVSKDMLVFCKKPIGHIGRHWTRALLREQMKVYFGEWGGDEEVEVKVIEFVV